MKTFEYKVFRGNALQQGISLEESINEISKNGWRLVKLKGGLGNEMQWEAVFERELS